MDESYIKLWRKSLDSGLIQNPNLWTFWTWCLLKASWKKRKMTINLQVIDLGPGQFIFGRKSASQQLGMSEQVIRTCLKKLKTLQNLTIKTTNKYSIITIVNWDSYQQQQPTANQQINPQLTSKQPAANHKQEGKKEKNVKKDIPDSAESGFYTTKKNRKLSGKRLEAFNKFWEIFNFKKDKANAADSWLDIPTLTDALVNDILAAAKVESQNRQSLIDSGSSPKWAQGWLTSRRWEDEVSTKQESSVPESEIIEYEYDEHGRPIF